MNKFRFTMNVLAFAAFTIALSAAAQAQATRTWVSGVGDDVNPCSRTAPCKTYAGAISKTAKDGEISTLDPGGFGAITITKSITINGTTGQGYGSILATATTGVIINITDVNDLRKTVRLNWLDINGATSSNPGLSGIRILASGAIVHVENCVIDSFRSASAGFGHGIHMNVTGTSELYVRNTTIRNCLNDGIRVETTAGQALASVVNSSISKNGNGIKYVNGGRGLVAGCEITNNATVNIDVEETTLDTIVNIEGNYIAFGTTGIQVGAGAAEARISNNFVTQHVTGLSIAAGNLFSSGNNRVIGNTTNGAPNQAVVQPI